MKAEHGRIDAFELWCWRRLLRVPLTARRSNQSILKELSPEYLLEGLMLKLQSFSHLMQRTDSLEKTLMLGKIKGRRRRWQDEMVGWHHQLNRHAFEWTLGVGDGQGGLECCNPLGRKVLDMTELNWTARRSNQSILKEINPEQSSLEGLILKLELQYFGHLMWKKRLWSWERWKAKGERGGRGWDG